MSNPEASDAVLLLGLLGESNLFVLFYLIAMEKKYLSGQ